MKVEFDGNVIGFIDKLLEFAVNNNISDVHIDASSTDTQVRIRLDGDLVNFTSVDSSHHQELITRIKILSELDIAERRLPQDGRFSIDNNIDVRVSILPTIGGESAVLRILNNHQKELSLDDLNFNDEVKNKLMEVISFNSGLVLSCGPTGCGKTTTLYSLLNILNKDNVSIVTVEDPVEYFIDGTQQIQVNDGIGMTFSRALRSILRSDPDIIMVGEIRDQETAEIAVRAAITGHLVLSTLHTVDAYSAIIRLIDMGIEPYLVASSLTCVQSQRLIKILCPSCSQNYQIDSNLYDLVKTVIGDGEFNFKRPVGCDKCLNGYLGRQAIAEIFTVDDDIRNLTKKKSDINDFRKEAKRINLDNMLTDGLKRAAQGQVYIEDVLKSTILIGD